MFIEINAMSILMKIYNPVVESNGIFDIFKNVKIVTEIDVR